MQLLLKAGSGILQLNWMFALLYRYVSIVSLLMHTVFCWLRSPVSRLRSPFSNVRLAHICVIYTFGTRVHTSCLNVPHSSPIDDPARPSTLQLSHRRSSSFNDIPVFPIFSLHFYFLSTLLFHNQVYWYSARNFIILFDCVMCVAVSI